MCQRTRLNHIAELLAWCVPVPVMPNLHQQICLVLGCPATGCSSLKYVGWCVIENMIVPYIFSLGPWKLWVPYIYIYYPMIYILYNVNVIYIYIHDGSMVLVYIYIYVNIKRYIHGIHVTIYGSSMDPSWSIELMVQNYQKVQNIPILSFCSTHGI